VAAKYSLEVENPDKLAELSAVLEMIKLDALHELMSDLYGTVEDESVRPISKGTPWILGLGGLDASLMQRQGSGGEEGGGNGMRNAPRMAHKARDEVRYAFVWERPQGRVGGLQLPSAGTSTVDYPLGSPSLCLEAANPYGLS
jgi:hypothetical protein